jgi:hypothetical protein
LGEIPRLAELHLKNITDAEEPPSNPNSSEAYATLHAVQSIHLTGGFAWGGTGCSPMHALARMTRIPATTKLCPPQRLSIKGWGSGWLPAALATMPSTTSQEGRRIVIAADDVDVDVYLAAVASMRPSQWPECSLVLWLGRQVSKEAFTRLLSCAHQPPVTLEVDSAVHGKLESYALNWEGCIDLGASHFRALCGLAAPQLVALVLADCGQLTNDDVWMLAGACHALKDLKLLGASKLGDPALYLLAAGCKQLQRVQLTHASVTAEGVVVALTTLGQLQRLEVGDWLEQLVVMVARQLMASGFLHWGVAGSEASVAWSRRGGRAG